MACQLNQFLLLTPVIPGNSSLQRGKPVVPMNWCIVIIKGLNGQRLAPSYGRVLGNCCPTVATVHAVLLGDTPASLMELVGHTRAITMLNCSRSYVISESFACSWSSCNICSQQNHQNLFAFSFSVSTATFKAATSLVSLSLVAHTICSSIIVSVAFSSFPIRVSIADSCLLMSWHWRLSSEASHALQLITGSSRVSWTGIWETRCTTLITPSFPSP